MSELEPTPIGNDLLELHNHLEGIMRERTGPDSEDEKEKYTYLRIAGKDGTSLYHKVGTEKEIKNDFYTHFGRNSRFNDLLDSYRKNPNRESNVVSNLHMTRESEKIFHVPIDGEELTRNGAGSKRSVSWFMKLLKPDPDRMREHRIKDLSISLKKVSPNNLKMRNGKDVRDEISKLDNSFTTHSRILKYLKIGGEGLDDKNLFEQTEGQGVNTFLKRRGVAQRLLLNELRLKAGLEPIIGTESDKTMLEKYLARKENTGFDSDKDIVKSFEF